MSQSRMRFSVWPNPQQSFAEVLEIARHAESTGWDGVWYADHFMPDGENTRVPQAEAWTTLAALAAAVPRIRIGPLVTGNTYRHPAVLAKMAATVDQLSGGRFVLGLGAGWQENEHRQYGIPFYTVRERLERLAEACELIQALFANEVTSFKGKHYTLDAAVLEPKPVQRPLPLLVGGGGEKVTLRIAAKFADEWNVWGDVATLQRKMALLDGYCTELGRSPRAIQRSAVALLFLTDDRARLERLKSRPIGRPTIAGNADEVREIVRAYRDAGVDELIVPDFTLGPRDQKLATLDLFMREVATPLR
jgi:F420-dependent oxidoreductase-like protein